MGMRGASHRIARIIGDVNVIKKSKVGKRVARRTAGKAIGRAMGRLFKKGV